MLTETAVQHGRSSCNYLWRCEIEKPRKHVSKRDHGSGDTLVRTLEILVSQIESLKDLIRRETLDVLTLLRTFKIHLHELDVSVRSLDARVTNHLIKAPQIPTLLVPKKSHSSVCDGAQLD